jgi:hypothetical protein
VKQFLHLLFFPHEKNNHKAGILKPAFIGIFIAVYILNQAVIKSLTIAKPGILGYSSEITAQKVYEQTNDQRVAAGLPLLHFNQTLSNSAQKKAQDMFANNYWAHNSPQGLTPWDFFHSVGYQYSTAGENLAKDFYDTDSMMKAWMNSPTHKANIVNNQYQEIGIGVVNGVLNGVKTTLVVQHFGTPLNAKVNADTPEELAYRTHTQVLSQNSVAAVSPRLVSPLQISQTVGILMFVLIIGVLFIDGYLTLKRNTHRLAGSSASHIGFLAVILILLLVSQQGNIF